MTEIPFNKETWNILRPHPNACQVCGRYPNHAAEQPHDAQSLFYQYSFYLEHARFPTWKDAVAHCTPEIKAAWERALRKRDAWPES